MKGEGIIRSKRDTSLFAPQSDAAIGPGSYDTVGPRPLPPHHGDNVGFLSSSGRVLLWESSPTRVPGLGRYNSEDPQSRSYKFSRSFADRVWPLRFSWVERPNIHAERESGPRPRDV